MRLRKRSCRTSAPACRKERSRRRPNNNCVIWVPGPAHHAVPDDRGEPPMKKIARRKFLEFSAFTATALTLPRPAFAQSYPTRPVKLVVAFTAGGTTDLLARILAQPLSERLGQQVVIENRPGGGTNIAMQSVVNAPPDGYTLAMTFATNTINPSLYRSLPFDF